MRRTTLMIERIVSLCLAFVLGFFSAFGAVAGGIYLVYSTVSVEKLNEWGEKFGFSIPLDGVVNPEAEMPATSLTIADLLAEIQQIQNSELTLKEMIERYGLLIPADIVDNMPESVMNEIPFVGLFSEEGLQMVMDSVTVTDILDMIPEEIAATMISNPAREAFSDNTLSEIVAMDMGHIFEGIELGYITGVTYILDENGVYQPVWADSENPTLLELIAPLDLGGVLGAVSNGEGDVLGVIKSSVGDVAINSIFGTFMSDITIVSGLLGEATLGDLIKLDPETGKYAIDMMSIVGNRKIGNLLGYSEAETIDENLEITYVWVDTSGNKVNGLPAKFADIYLSDFMSGTVSFDTIMNDLVIADVLGYEKGDKLPVFMYDNLDNQLIIPDEITVWYTNGVPADKLMNAFAGKTISWIGSSVSTLKLADILGYYMYEGEWYVWNVESVNGSDAIVLSTGSSVMAEIADTSIGGLGNIESTLKDIKIGTLLGYKSVSDEDGNLYWSSGVNDAGEPVKATGITASMADLTINELADGYTLQSTIDGITIADVMGYTKGEDGKWYHGGTVVSGPMAALAGSKVGSLATDISSVRIGELLGHTPVYMNDNDQVVDHWVDANGNVVGGFMAGFVGLSVNDMKDNEKVMSTVQDIQISEVMGLKLVDGVWCNSDGTKATGIMAAIADIKIGDLSSEMESITIGEIAGYIKLETGDPNANEGEGWYTYDGTTYTKATGILAGLSDLTVNQLTDSEGDALSNKIGNIKLAEALGYTEVDGVWYDKSNQPISGIMSALADKPINDMSGAIDDLTLKDIFPGKKEGVLSLIDENTKVSGIDEAINNSVKNTPVQYFIDEGLIELDTKTISYLDYVSINSKDGSEMVSLTEEMVNSGYYDKWIESHPNSNLIPKWRTQELTKSFNYIVGLLTPAGLN